MKCWIFCSSLGLMSLFIFKLLCCYQEEMDIQVLRFQNKKLSERLEERKVEEENLKIQIEEYKKKERDNTELLSVIHRSWNQVNLRLIPPLRTLHPETILQLFLSLFKRQWCVFAWTKCPTKIKFKKVGVLPKSNLICHLKNLICHFKNLICYLDFTRVLSQNL